MSETLHVGGRSITMDAARKVARQYLIENRGKSAYPAYDGYPGHSGPEVGLQDLLAVVLLNVSNRPIPVYYGLASMIGELNRCLDVLPASENLQGADSAVLQRIIDLLGVIDRVPAAHVRLTTISKVLHRKRPNLIPLFDANIAYCYSECAEAPVPFTSSGTRSLNEYRLLWLKAVKNDLSSQLDHWQELADFAPGPPITPLRALDIIGWELGRKKNRGER
ncbi:DUF6308 family protein [Arthrobacter sp. TMS2-4]